MVNDTTTRTEKEDNTMSDNTLFNLFSRAVDGGLDIDFAARCSGEVQDRIDSGRSQDCDAWRTLLRAAKNVEVAS